MGGQRGRQPLRALPRTGRTRGRSGDGYGTRAAVRWAGPLPAMRSARAAAVHLPDVPEEKARILARGGRVVAMRGVAPDDAGPARVFLVRGRPRARPATPQALTAAALCPFALASRRWTCRAC